MDLEIFMDPFQLEIFCGFVIYPYCWTAAAPQGGCGFAPAVQIPPQCTMECVCWHFNYFAGRITDGRNFSLYSRISVRHPHLLAAFLLFISLLCLPSLPVLAMDVCRSVFKLPFVCCGLCVPPKDQIRSNWIPGSIQAVLDWCGERVRKAEVSPFQSAIHHVPDQNPTINNAKIQIVSWATSKIFPSQNAFCSEKTISLEQFPQTHFFFLFFLEGLAMWVSGEVANIFPKWSIAFPNNSVTWFYGMKFSLVGG